MSRRSSRRLRSSKPKHGRCSSGKILRKAYSKKSGTRVPSRCILSVSRTGRKRSTSNRRLMSAKARLHKEARKKFKGRFSAKCHRGEILREGTRAKSYSRRSYSRRSGIRVKSAKVKSAWRAPACIKSRTGKSTKGVPRIGPLEKGVLAKFGYHRVENLSKHDRHVALRKALRKIPALSLYRSLKAVATLSKNINRRAFRIFRDDAKWVKRTREYVRRATRRSGGSRKRSSRRNH